jgi:hypothetical protein
MQRSEAIGGSMIEPTEKKCEDCTCGGWVITADPLTFWAYDKGEAAGEERFPLWSGGGHTPTGKLHGEHATLGLAMKAAGRVRDNRPS